MKKTLLKLGILFIGLISALLISEVILRIFWNPPYLNPKYKRDDFSWMNKNVLLNNFGYRDDDVSLEKNINTIRIYSLGDSFTYGWYIDDPKLSYPNKLEELLNQKSTKDQNGINFEVINAAQPGFKIKDSVDRYESEGVVFSPDIITLGINLFDLMDKEFPSKAPKLKFLKKSRLYELIIGSFNRNKISNLTEKELQDTLKQDSEQLRKVKESIEKLDELVTSNGGKLIIIVFPNYDPINPNKPYSYADYHERIKEIIPENVQLVDLLTIFNTVSDKRELVLNPTDDHPTILANSLAASEIIKQFDFEKFISLHKIVQNEKKSLQVSIGTQLLDLRSFISAEDQVNQWVYFDLKNDLSVQKKILENKGDRHIGFMRDSLETTKSLTHDGWVGAKIEMYFPGYQEIIFGRNSYQYPIVGISQVTIYKRENDSTISENLDLSSLEIIRDSQNISIKSLPKNAYFYRVIVDVAVNQMDIDKGIVKLFSKTEIKKAKINKGDYKINLKISEDKFSLPKYISTNENYGYVWIKDKMRKVNLSKSDGEVILEFIIPSEENTEIEIPVQLKLEEKTGPVVNYI